MLSLEPFSEDRGRSRCNLGGIPPVSFLAPYGFTRPLTRNMSDSLVRVSRRAEWGARRPTPGARWCRGTRDGRAAVHDRCDGVSRAFLVPGLGPPLRSRRSAPEPIGGSGLPPFTSDRGASPAPYASPPTFQALFDSLSKSFSSFPRGTCSLRSLAVFSRTEFTARLGLHSQQPDSQKRLVVRQGPGTTGLSPLRRPLPGGLVPHGARELRPVTMWYQSRPQRRSESRQAPQRDRGRQGADGDKGVLEWVGENVRPQWDRGRHGFLNPTSDKKGFDPRDKCGLSCSWYASGEQRDESWQRHLEDVCVRKWVSALANWWPICCSSVCVGERKNGLWTPMCEGV
ncbi:hypothetical protein GH714_044016 [Hevea brasiliensis]|uniref:Uncharacterized protein n=1 Tax=Hevea brasiliensis TaxID=3981 RepID=A0A6A6K2D2_HEVBR|nr:hypothetical protein GH714_044016 [Hevea brasiliensis]